MNLTATHLAQQLELLRLRSSISTAASGYPRLRLSRGRSSTAYSLVQAPGVRLSTLDPRVADQSPFVHTDHVGLKSAEAFRRRGIQYLDLAGNAWIEFGEVLISVRGEPRAKNMRLAHSDAARSASGDLFSSGRSQVIMSLLAWPELWQRPQRELAEASGVSLGQAHKTLLLLEQAGWAARASRDQRMSLLQTWAAAFPTGLARRVHLASFSGDISWSPRTAELDPPAISGESAVPGLLRPATLTLYVRDQALDLALRHRWRRDGGSPNIEVRRKFWRVPSWSQPDPFSDGRAPWPLIYADLMSSDDPRVRQTAKIVEKEHG